MANYANLDAIIPRADFQARVKRSYNAHPPSDRISLLSFSESLATEYRKPDFQRETNRWEPGKVCDLIQTFLRGDLVPAIILWQHGQYHFVVDGAHRLSALLAWVYDDYGDGERSRELSEHIPDYQRDAATKTKKMIEKSVGSYRDFVDNPKKKSQLANINIYWQWVPTTNTIEQVEASFRRINKQGSRIPPLELKLLTDRRQPQTIAARSIINAGQGHKAGKFSTEEQATISETAKEVHDLLFKPSLPTKIRTLDLPLGGSPTAGTILPMIWELVVIAVESGLKQETPAKQTIECLNRVRSLVRTICSSHPSSYALHPAVYVYSWRGAHQSRQLIATIKFFARLEATNKTDLFVKKRAEFEGFLVKYRSIPAQIIRKWGGKPQTSERLAEFFQDLFEKVADGKTEKEIIGSLIFKPEEASPGTPGEDFSEAVKSGVALRDLLRSALQCKECHAPMPSWCMSPDHSDPKRDGGSSGAKNLAYMHPRCNHGVKEQRSARDKKS